MSTRATGTKIPVPTGVGIGFRRDLAEALLTSSSALPRFIELAPENWMQIGGLWGRTLRQAAERYPILGHGLSLSLGSPEDLDFDFLTDLKRFLREIPVALYSEHLSFCKCDNAHLYELLPIPFRASAVTHVAGRIRQVQEILECRIAIENVSYYASVAPEMGEAEFLSSILNEADCDLLLDVNNVYVNAFNHGYDARQFLQSLPLNRVSYLHMAGHEQREPDLIIDTHGAPIIDPVYELFEWTVKLIKPVPVLLERDFNIPELPELMLEMEKLQGIIDSAWRVPYAA